MFLVRAAFWLTVIAFILPIAASSPDPERSGFHPAALTAEGASVGSGAASSALPAPEISAGEVISLLGRSAEDVLGFCDRNPDVCAQSRAVVRHVAHQVYHYGGRMIVWLAAQINEPSAESAADPAAGEPLMPLMPRTLPSEA